MTVPESVLLKHLHDNYNELPRHVHSLSRYLPFYQEGMQALLLPHERDTMYSYIVPGIINKAELEHFKQRQTHSTGMQITARVEDAIHYHEERVLMFFEWVRCFPFVQYDEREERWKRVRKNTETYTAYIIFKHRKNFANLEAIAQWRRLGVAMPTENKDGKPYDLYRLCTHWVIKYFIDYQVWKRDHRTVDLETFYMRRYSKIPGAQALRTFERRMNWVERLIINSGGLNDYRLVGMGQAYHDLELAMEMNYV